MYLDWYIKDAEATCVIIITEVKNCFRLKDMLNFNVLPQVFIPYKYALQALFRNRETNFPKLVIPKPIYAVILESSKNNDLFQNRQPYSWKVSFIGFCKTANLVCKSEVKTSKNGRHMFLATSCKEIASSNTKECIIDIKWVEQLFFFCFRYISIASKSSKIASNVYLPHPALLLALM